MFHLSLDSVIEALHVLQKEREYAAASLLDTEDMTPEFEHRAKVRISTINRSCKKLTSKIIEAVEDMP